MKVFNWANIDRGFKGFEDLACEYVKKEYPSDTEWESTQYTRDGNRDGYSIIFGFRPHDLSPEEWWMEAKYSTEKKRLTRYRLDSTIVSAAIHGNVSKLIFVTNIAISTKTIVDIRAALKQAIQCREIHFCVKSTLEYWLTKNTEVFSRYFPDTDIKSLSVVPLFLSEEIEFFSNQKIGVSFSEPLKYLQCGEEYYLYFSVYSDRNRSLSLTVGEKFSGINIASPKKIKLQSGVTPCVVKINVDRNYSMLYQLADGREVLRTDLLDGAILKLGSLDLIVKTPLDVIESKNQILVIPSQEQNYRILCSAFDATYGKKQSSINILVGASGFGKTYLMERFAKNKLGIEYNTFRVTFSTHQITNDLQIYYFLVFCLFPFLPPETVDAAYLQSLGDIGVLQSAIYEASQLLNQPDRLHQFYASTVCQDIFPRDMHINPRVILFDDMQKLSSDSLQFLFTAILELVQKQQPIFLITNGWPDVKNNPAYNSLKSNSCFQELTCTLTSNDLVEVISNAGIIDFEFDSRLFAVFFPNVVELISFIKFHEGSTIHSLEELMVKCRLFLAGDIAKASILRRFQKVFEIDPIAKDLCTRIYWSVNGIPIQSPISSSESNLLQNELVKVDDGNMRLIPYHDLYRKIFHQRFELPKDTATFDEDDIYANTAKILTYGSSKDELKSALALLGQWKSEGRFYGILYVLENLFESDLKENLRSTVGEVTYFQLFLYYAYGVTNGSRTKAGKDVFLDIVHESEFKTDPEILKIRVDALFELINSCFEWLMHDTSIKYISEMEELIKSLQQLGKFSKDINESEKYILSKQVYMLISSEKNEERTEDLFLELDNITQTYHYDYEREFFRLRYAESLYYRDTTRAFKMVGKCMKELRTLRGSEEKFYIWAKMDYEFLKFVLHDPDANLELVMSAHNALKKNFFNDYRKRLLALASIYYSCGLIKGGDSIIFSDMTTLRELRPRQKGFYSETMALRYVLSGETNKAIEELCKAAKIFHNLPTYLDIIKHNLSILNQGVFNQKSIDFCTDGICKPNIYCIDPRCIW